LTGPNKQFLPRSYIIGLLETIPPPPKKKIKEGQRRIAARVQIQKELIFDLMCKNVEIREKRLGTAVEINRKCNTKTISE
jgi:hypothetical protein